MTERSSLLRPPWFALLILPFGIVTGYCTVTLPRLLDLRGFSAAAIGAFLAVAFQPRAWKFLYEPALDARWQRRSWYLAAVAVTAAALFASVLVPESLGLLGATLFVGNAAVSIASSATHALMATTLPEDRRGTAAGWAMAANLGGTGLGGAVALLLTQNAPRLLAAVVLALMVLACAAPALVIVEPERPRRAVGRALRELIRDTWRTLRSSEGWTGLVICLAPVGAGGAKDLFSAMASDYGAGDAEVALVNGIGGGLVSAAGCLIGGYVADRIDRRATYVLAGSLSAVLALGMAWAPLTPGVYAAGCLAYQLAIGIAFAAWTAFVLDLMGNDQAVATKHALFAAAGNQATNYMVVLDGLAKDGRLLPGLVGAGPAAMLKMDALATAVGVVILGAMMVWVRRRRARGTRSDR